MVWQTSSIIKYRKKVMIESKLKGSGQNADLGNKKQGKNENNQENDDEESRRNKSDGNNIFKSSGN